MDKYLYIAPSVIIQRYESRDRELFVLQSPEQNEKERLTGGKRYKINSVAAEIIACLDGTRTFGEIVAYFSKKYSDDETHVRQTVQSYFDKLESLYGFSVKEIEEPTLFPVQFTDYKSIYPTVVSIELTDKCNFRCKHCYGSFKPENEHEIPNEMLQPLFTSLKEIGVLTVELTGGDVSVYPHTATAIETAINCGIQSVMILTNGAIISDDIIKVMSKYKDRCFVQVDLHSLNTEYFDWFTGTKGMLPKVMHNIDVLIAAGVQVRVCSIITPLNFQEFVDIASWSHQHGANVLEIKKINKTYPNTSFALKDIDICVPEGEIVGLVGKNGAGKTTLISLVLDQINPDSGAIEFFGCSNKGSNIQNTKDNLGFVIDECCYHSCLSSVEIGNVLKHVYNKWDSHRYNGYLKQFDVDPSKKISEMSKGMKSKMMLATALAHTPKLLVLDEITSGLDPVVRDDILHILKDYVAETSNAVFFSTHITSDLDKIADRVAFLHEGELIFEEEIENLRKRFILYTCSDTSTTMSDESAVVAKYSEFNNTHYLLEKEKTVLKGNVPTIDDIMLLYIKGREKK